MQEKRHALLEEVGLAEPAMQLVLPRRAVLREMQHGF